MSTVHRTRGDDWTGDNAITGQLGSTDDPLDITSATITSTLRYGHPDGDVAATFTVTKTDATDGRLSLSLPASTTRLLREGLCVYDIAVVIDGKETTYGVGSQVKVSADATQVAP